MSSSTSAFAAPRPKWLASCAFALLLAACGGGGGGGGGAIPFVPVTQQPQPGAPERSALLTRVKAEPAGGSCPQGGARVDAGIDGNGDGVLADSEVSSTQYVCSGADGYDTLVRVRAEPAGSHCAQGGSLVLAGRDLNRDQVLDDAEVTTTAYVCNAAPADTRWVEVTAASVQTESNTGYHANAATGVTLTLPPSPAVGDWVKVVGVGSGGWTLAQNAGQRITTRGLPGGLAITWNPQVLAGIWTGLAASSDGTQLAAVAADGALLTSDDAGANWTPRLTGQVWSGVASSSDGQRLVAVVNGGAIFRSTDGGASWSDDGSARAWTAVASSADGMRLAATAYLGQIWTSADGGNSWVARESNRAWRAVASSADGRVLVAATNGAQLYVSTDYGVSWTARASGSFWWAVAASADGSILYATVDTGSVWVSRDSGASWEAQSVAREWRGIATSADGRMAVAATNNGRLYESTDAGQTWRATGDASAWNAVASSADGLQVFAASAAGAVHAGVRGTATTPGTAGSISGGPQDALQLQYVGGGVFMPVGYVMANGSFVIR